MTVESINNINICYDTHCTDHNLYIYDYHCYCIDLLRQRAAQSQAAINIIFGQCSYNFNNSNRTLRVGAQHEHTLIKTEETSHTKYSDSYYLTRIDNLDYLNTLDHVFEYSMPNICNVKSNEAFADLSSKTLYIAPTWYDINFDSGHRNNIITLHTTNPRRNNITERILQQQIPLTNITGCNGRQNICKLYTETKILINVHQTENHRTFEELRVLPALLNGVIIVSEDVPLRETIPYSDYIIWTDYEDIPRIAAEVANNYHTHYQKLFANSPLESLLKDMKMNNLKNLDILGF